MPIASYDFLYNKDANVNSVLAIEHGFLMDDKTALVICHPSVNARTGFC